MRPAHGAPSQCTCNSHDSPRLHTIFKKYDAKKTAEIPCARGLPDRPQLVRFVWVLECQRASPSVPLAGGDDRLAAADLGFFAHAHTRTRALHSTRSPQFSHANDKKTRMCCNGMNRNLAAGAQPVCSATSCVGGTVVAKNRPLGAMCTDAGSSLTSATFQVAAGLAALELFVHKGTYNGDNTPEESRWLVATPRVCGGTGGRCSVRMVA